MLIHSLACLVAGVLTTANPAAAAIPSAAATASPLSASAGSPEWDPAAMSIESVLARLEQVGALREIALRSGRTDRLADLDALEARLFDLAQQLAAAPLDASNAPARTRRAAQPHAPGAPRAGTRQLVAVPSGQAEEETPSRRVFEGEIISPLGEDKPKEMQMQLLERDEEGNARSSRRVISSIFNRQGEGNGHPLSLTGAMRRAIPAELATSPGMVREGAETAVPSAISMESSGRRVVTEIRAVPSADGATMSTGDRRSAASIDEALRELRTDIASAPR